MNRRGFLKLLAASPFAAYLPQIEAAPELDAFPFEYIESGKVPLSIALAGDIGEYTEFGRMPVKVRDGVVIGAVVFPVITRTCIVTHALLCAGHHVRPIPFPLGSGRPIHVIPGDMINLDMRVTLDT